MERLTNSEKEIPTLVNNAEYWLQVYFKLKDIEDLEEQGLLLRLPCKVGDRLYRIDFLGFIISDTVHSIHILQNTAYLEMNYWDKDISLSEVGKTVFLTQEEVEQKLKEMESDWYDIGRKNRTREIQSESW